MTRSPVLADLYSIALPDQPALSPDGDRLVYVLHRPDQATDATVDSLWLAQGDEPPRPWSAGPADAAPAFSPDGRRLAFLRGGQIWSAPAAGGDPEQLTELPLGAGAPLWSPDGRQIVFAALTPPAGGPDAGAGPATAPLVVDRLDYQADGHGFLAGAVSQLYLLDPVSRGLRQLTDGANHAYSPAFSPDGAVLAFAARPAGPPDDSLVAAVDLLDPHDPKAQPKLAAWPEGTVGLVATGPDSDHWLVVGWSDRPLGQAGLWLIDSASGQARDLTGALDRNVMPGAPAYPGAPPRLTADGQTALFCLRDHGCTHLYAVDLASGQTRLVLGGDGLVVSGLAQAGSRLVAALATPTSYGEIVEVDWADGSTGNRPFKPLTDHGAGLTEVAPLIRRPRQFQLSDGGTVEGWLLRADDNAGPTPLLLDVHGGPHNAWSGASDAGHLYHQELAAAGWTVLILNPRGSDGYGDAFFQAVTGAWGLSDAADLLEPLDQLVAEGVADPKRLALTGYSYGGYMTCYLTSRQDRFAAAVAGGVGSDLVSIMGTSDEGQAMAIELGHQPWQDQDRLAAMSPQARLDQVTTPTLILQGEADRRCPLGQAQQWFYGLRAQGVPTELVVYPQGSHIFPLAGRPSHRIDYGRRLIDWVERFAGDPAGPLPPRLDQAHWAGRLARLAAKHGVPGAQLGLLRLGSADGRRPDDQAVAVHGVLSLDTDVPVRPDSLFQIGSISKVWTATLAMQLIDEGQLSLDTKVVDVLPELSLRDAEAQREMTIWHLLTHTNGIDGDVFTDTGRGDDAVAKYVAALAEAAQNHPLGATWSYSNSGFALLGAVIERITGQTWDEALKQRLYTPLGLTRTATLPEELLLRSIAVGHVGVAPDLAVAPIALLPRSIGPAGLISSTVSDLLQFARLHLLGGLAPDGARLLSLASAQAMAEFQVELPDKYMLGDSWGLGWIRYDWNGYRAIGHDGNTVGQAAFLRLLPQHGLAIALLTNGGSSHDLYEELYRELALELAGVEMQWPLGLPESPVEVDITEHLGVYERESVRMEVLIGPDGPCLRTTTLGMLSDLTDTPVEESALRPVAPGLFATKPPGMDTWVPVTFYSLATGEPYLHHGGRATPKTGGPA
ncbi:MAG: serine hydrolase [Propionibacteriaceae bacterium]|jgi:dipeptidyl aminopeptidase/acylaminoacyl peptidase/CubicO group peptidase (beta-lactamase class C family)|nr:serine hydrolase [Propionibacteriaceae bacterium]